MNGTQESIKTIVEGLNNAQLDPKVGEYIPFITFKLRFLTQN